LSFGDVLSNDNGADFGCLSIPGVYFAQDIPDKSSERKMYLIS